MRIAIIFLTFISLSCNQNTKTEESSLKPETVSSTLAISNDTLAMEQTVKGFLTWYKTNYTEANSFGFTYQDKQGNYHVSVPQGEEYLKFLKSSGFISDKYVDVWLKYFKDKADYLEANLQTEGPPEGFEFDLVLITQEPELVLKEIDNLKFALTENNGDKAILQVAGQFGYDFELSKENGKWLIEYISTMNYD